ncbi:MAG TPA: glycine--tRNA ligase subunit beta [Virgibacillus sp.]|nr:glycine--tRNA ligase subunit beta [Virgibacillus sp.]HLR66481.1 glycine--tRNA ligase subunit beta [Virgibacillus sp.]
MTKGILFEIGLEELPARFIYNAEKQLATKTKNWLEKLRISFESITTYSTPRRLAVLIKKAAEEQTTIEEEAKGPAEKIAKDEHGDWTKAAIGFTKGQGKTTDDIYTKEVKGTNYIFVKKHIIGKRTKDLLPSFQSIIESIQFANNMRWAEETIRYARPIRWLVALYGEHVIPFEIAHVKTSNITYGHRYLGKTIQLQSPDEYETKLKDNFVIANPQDRKQLILDGIQSLERKESFQVPVEQDLLNEVCNLVEYPSVFQGSFDPDFLQLPSEVLVTSMKEHQRYFPVKSNEGKLLPYFIGVRNGDYHAIHTVIKGNEKVLKARLSDAQFFYEEDRKQSISFFQKKLERVVFQDKLGTLKDKVDRIVEISEQLGKLLNLDKNTLTKVKRAAEICKFDLTTNMVNEFTELQGIMGETYALHFNEDAEVAKGLREHYLPDHANGELPVTILGSIVSVADKLDTIVGCIAAGLVPSGSQDPYGLRRQAVAILRIMESNNWNISLESLINITLNRYQALPVDLKINNDVKNELNKFFRLRATFLFKEMGIEQDVIQAVLHNEIGVFGYTVDKASVLSEKRNDDSFKNVQEALVRILNLSKHSHRDEVNPAIFETSSEQMLFDKYQETHQAYKTANKDRNADEALKQLGKLAEPIHHFFEHNMVMSDDEKIRNNRLSLVNHIAMLINDFADLSAVEWKQHF